MSNVHVAELEVGEHPAGAQHHGNLGGTRVAKR